MSSQWIIWGSLGLMVLLLGWGTWRGVALLRQGRMLTAAHRAVWLLAGVAALGLAGLTVLNALTWQRLRHEQPVARVSMQQLEPQLFRLRLAPPGQSPTDYLVAGDEWQVDARVLVWKPLANLLGFDAFYRLERLSGRFRDIRQARVRRPSVHDLRRLRGPDLASWLQRAPLGLDVHYGSSAYMPMADGARYQVMLTQTGLIIRPDNAAARSAVTAWHD